MLQTGSVSQTDGWINQSVDDLVFAYYSNCFHTTFTSFFSTCDKFDERIKSNSGLSILPTVAFACTLEQPETEPPTSLS